VSSAMAESGASMPTNDAISSIGLGVKIGVAFDGSTSGSRSPVSRSSKRSRCFSPRDSSRRVTTMMITLTTTINPRISNTNQPDISDLYIGQSGCGRVPLRPPDTPGEGMRLPECYTQQPTRYGPLFTLANRILPLDPSHPLTRFFHPHRVHGERHAEEMP